MVLHSSCPLCKDGGRIGFRMCADRETMLLVCDECALVWARPDEVDEAHALDPLLPDFARRLPGVTLADSRWATADEVLAYGWGQWITALNATPRGDTSNDDAMPKATGDDRPTS